MIPWACLTQRCTAHAASCCCTQVGKHLLSPLCSHTSAMTMAAQGWRRTQGMRLCRRYEYQKLHENAWNITLYAWFIILIWRRTKWCPLGSLEGAHLSGLAPALSFIYVFLAIHTSRDVPARAGRASLLALFPLYVMLIYVTLGCRELFTSYVVFLSFLSFTPGFHEHARSFFMRAHDLSKQISSGLCFSCTPLSVVRNA